MAEKKGKYNRMRKHDRIMVTDEITGKLVTEFNTSNQTVLNSLKFFNLSELSVKIRARAMRLMDETVKENKVVYRNRETTTNKELLDQE